MSDPTAVVVGNGFTKAYTERKQVTFKSVIAIEQSGIEFGGFATADDFVIEWNGKRYAIGASTDRLSDIPITRMDRSRIGSPFYTTLLLAALTEVAKEPGAISLVLTLPIDWYQKREDFKEALSGSYTVKRNRKTYTWEIHPSGIRVLPEGFGVLAGQALNARGEMETHNIARAKIGVVEIGTGTTDLSFFNNLQIHPPKSTSLTQGLGKIWRAIQAEIKKEYGRDLSLHAIDDAIQIGHFTHAGQQIALKPLFDKYAPEIVGNITGQIDDLWESGNLPDRIYLAGGGASQLYNHFPYKHAERVDNPWMADAAGIYRYAKFRDNGGSK